MKPYSPSPVLAVAIIATQLLGSTALWAAEQRGIRVEATRQIVVSALSGDQLTLQRESGASPLRFREVLAEGARVTTGVGTTAELLIGNRAVVTLGNGTMAQVRTVGADQATIQVTNGTVRVAAAASALGAQGLVTVQTPTSQVQTRGGILRVTVDAPVRKAEDNPIGAQAYRASYTASPLLAATTLPSDLIHVEEGTAEIPGAGPTGGPFTMKAGQRVTVQAGRAGNPTDVGSLGAGTTGIPAITGHALTPKEGRDYLVALQVDQAAQLGKALIGPAETAGKEESGKKSDTKNVINGATGGVALPNLVSALFGTGSAANPAGSNPTNSTGTGYGGNNNSGFGTSSVCVSSSNCAASVKSNGGNALLVFTRKDPVEPLVKETKTLKLPGFPEQGIPESEVVVKAGNLCGEDCLANHTEANLMSNVGYRPLNSIPSEFRVDKELILVGSSSNAAHGGIAPMETLIVRGANFTNLAETDKANGLYPTDRDPAKIGLFSPTPPQIVAANSTFVVETKSVFDDTVLPDDSDGSPGGLVGGTLGQFSNRSQPSPNGIAITDLTCCGVSHVDGAITATGFNVVLKGGVALDQRTTATMGTTPATNTYFTTLPNTLGRKFSGSLLSVIRGPNNTPTALTIQDRMLGVYDGSIVKSEGGDKALLSVLDAKLKGPGSSIPLIEIAAGKHFTLGADIALDGKRTVTESPGSPPNVTVTSALVTRSTLPLDGALLEASTPLFALTQATMTTTSHFADLAGNQAQSLNLNGALVALNASKLVIDSGHLLNLNNATAAITGYLFSLTNGSTLQLSNGSLFSLNGNSSLTLNGNAFGVFGSGSNTVTIDNNLCGAGAACGALVNSAGQAITLQDGTALKVAGVTQNVVLPNGFNVFAQAPNAGTPKVQIDANDALFKVDGTSTLTINGTKVH